MSIGMIDAIAGGGKTTAIVRQAIELATTLKQRICIALPTKEVIDEKYYDACALADGRVAVQRLHGDVPGCDNVGQRLEQLLSEIGTRRPAVLFITHKTFNDCPNWIGRSSWKFYIDELFDPVEHTQMRLPHNHAILTGLLELATPEDVFSEVRVAASSRRAFDSLRDGTDEVDAVFDRITARLAHPDRWRVYVECENYRTVASGIGCSSLVDQRQRAAVLHFWAVQQPWFDQQRLDVTLASACFTDRLLYKLWRRQGAEFQQDQDVMARLLANTHNSSGLELHCMNIAHWSAWAKRGGKPGKLAADATPQRQLERLIGQTFGDEPFIFNANADWQGKPPGPNGLQIGVVAHGKNAYSHFRNVAFMPSLLPVPDKWRFLSWLGFSDDDIRDEYYHSHAYQTVFRSAARLQQRAGVVKAVLPGRAACDYVQRKAPGSIIIEHEVLSAQRPRGRPVKYLELSERRAANAQQMRLRRQKARAGHVAA